MNENQIDKLAELMAKINEYSRKSDEKLFSMIQALNKKLDILQEHQNRILELIEKVVKHYDR